LILKNSLNLCQESWGKRGKARLKALLWGKNS